jgi:hypothetical protein
MSYQENSRNATIVLDALRNLVTTRQKDEEELTDYTRTRWLEDEIEENGHF